MEKTVLPIHFEDRSGIEFERLAFAYVTQLKDWDSIQWLCQTGDDGGRDIWAITNGESFCYQCANYRSMTLSKATEDIDKLVKGNTIPDCFIVICGGRISSDMRDKIVSYADSKKITKAGVWSGAEFEEKLRKETPELRFADGETFPDLPSELSKYAKSFAVKNDTDIIELIGECFDRPAFITRFRNEASIPDFEKAIKDTIEVLNTGVHRLRDGTVIRTIPSRHRVSDTDLKKKLSDITILVVKLRDNFVAFKKSKEPCNCRQADCPVYMLSDKACETMDKIREEIFIKFREIKPDFDLRVD